MMYYLFCGDELLYDVVIKSFILSYYAVVCYCVGKVMNYNLYNV